MRIAGPVLCITAVLAAGCVTTPQETPPAGAMSSADAASFVVTLGRDTIGAERFAWSPGRLQGEVALRRNQRGRRPYTFTWTADRSKLEFATYDPTRPAGTPPMQSVTVEIAGDTLVWNRRRNDSTTTQRLTVPRGTLPLMIGASYGAYELVTRRARQLGGDSVSIPVWPIGGQQTSVWRVVRNGTDSVVLITHFDTERLRVDATGRILGLHAPGTTNKVVVTRLSPTAIDVAEIASRPMVAVSPRDTARATIGPATLVIDYGRPAKRGRTVFGGELVPWGVVWRTGANQATHFRTDRDLVIGGTPVPAGLYTMWTLPAPEGWKLIINKQTGQWGTIYDQAQDLARIDLRVEPAPSETEVFTITLEPQGATQGALRLAWDDKVAWVPIEVK